MFETRRQEMLRLQAEIAEREARLKHIAWSADRAGEVRIKLVVEPVTTGQEQAK